MGRRLCQPHALRRRMRAPSARLHIGALRHHLPFVDARSGRRWQHLGRDRAARVRSRASRRNDPQHRHRLARGARADNRDDGAARAVRRRGEAAAWRRRPAAGCQQPHQRPGGCRSRARERRRRPDLDGEAAARRCRLRAQGRRRPRRRDQHLHRLQPGLPGRKLRGARDVLYGQSTCVPRDRMGRAAGTAAAARGGGRRRASRSSLRGYRSRARPCGDLVRCATAHRRAVQPRVPHPRQGGVRADAALFRAPPCAAGRGAAAGAACRCRHVARRQLRACRARHRRAAAPPGHRRHRPSSGGQLCRRDRRAQARRTPRGRHRCRRYRL